VFGESTMGMSKASDGGGRTRFTVLGGISLCAVIAFSAVHMLRLNGVLVNHRNLSRTNAGTVAVPTKPAAVDVVRQPLVPAHTAPTPVATAPTVSESHASTMTAPAQQDEGTIFGVPRSAYVRVIDEAEIRARDCPNRKPFHSLLTVQDRKYME
jgi:hypothetical protein